VQRGIWVPTQPLLKGPKKTTENLDRIALEAKAHVNNSLFKNSVRTSKRTLRFTITKINWLMLFKEIISVYQDRIKGFVGPRHFSLLGLLETRKVLLELQCTLDYPG
jgi:hypothetical protein